MRNAKFTLIALGLATLTTGCCSTGQPGFFSRFRSCMCGGNKDAMPVSYSGAPMMGTPMIMSGPALGPNEQPSNPTIPPAGIYETPGKQMPYKPEDKGTSRPAKPITEAKITRE